MLTRLTRTDATRVAFVALATSEPNPADDAAAVFFTAADALAASLDQAPAGLTRSAAGRSTGLDTVTAGSVLDWMVRHHYAHTSGNGTRTRYHAGRSAR